MHARLDAPHPMQGQLVPGNANSTRQARPIQPARRRRPFGCLALLFALATLEVACAASFELPPDPTMAARPADWDDIDAAVEVLQTRLELGLLQRTVTPDARIYHFLSIEDEIVTLSFQRSGDGVVASCALDLRDPEREQVILDAVLERLGDLHGVDVAPLQD
ncbi:MAG: hypothetical protein KDA28_07960 [Phycisphaerales bacterium]|nr:hypothetical protein [Phycisphaerales bacterium]